MNTRIFPYDFARENVEGLCARHNLRSQVIYLSVLLSMGLGLASLPFIEVDVSTQQRGIIRARQKNNQLAAPVSAQILEARAREGQQVLQGDTLLVLNAALIDEQLRGLAEQADQAERCIRDLQRLATMDTSQLALLETALYYQEYIQYSQKEAELQLEVEFTQQALGRSQLLFEGGAIARVELEQAEFNASRARRILESFREQTLRNWRLEQEKYQRELLEIRTRARQGEKEKAAYYLTAPISGAIAEAEGLTAGNFVAPNQPIATITADDTLIVECFISPADIGLIREGMKVQFQIDAYNYNQWGLANGIVIDIAQDIILTEGRPTFSVKCSLQQKALRLSNGYLGKLKKGMTLTARFSITRRSLYQLLYDKADHWLNPKMG